MNAVTEMPAPLVFTANAAAKVKSLIDEEGNPELKLRVFVTGGGCSGFQYGFTFDEVINEDDTMMEKNGVQLGEMNMLLLKKIEELTLYVIELKKENKKQQNMIDAIQNKK